MKKILVAFMSVMMIFTSSLGNIAFAEDVKEIEHIIFVDDESLIENEGNEDSDITPFGYEHEKEYKDGWIIKAPEGSTSKTFSVDSGDTKLNVWFDNTSDVSVNMTLLKKSGVFGSWSRVDSESIDAGKNDTITVDNPDPDVTYKVEIANTTGHKILGTLRIRSFVY